jgi:hypothetical protein
MIIRRKLKAIREKYVKTPLHPLNLTLNHLGLSPRLCDVKLATNIWAMAWSTQEHTCLPAGQSKKI